MRGDTVVSDGIGRFPPIFLYHIYFSSLSLSRNTLTRGVTLRSRNTEMITEFGIFAAREDASSWKWKPETLDIFKWGDVN